MTAGRGYRYTYYCYFDADTALENWHVGWHNFESFLREWEPAVGLPSLDGYRVLSSATLSRCDLSSFVMPHRAPVSR